MGTELERLRRRLYAAGALDADVAAYRVALAAEPPPVPEPTAASASASAPRWRPRRPALAAALSAAVAIAAVGIATTAAQVAPGSPATPSAEVLVRPALQLTSSPQGLTTRVDVQRLIDRVFAEQDGVAEERLDDDVRSTALPDAGSRTALGSAGARADAGSADPGRVVLDLGRGGLAVGTGDVLLLSVITREPASSTWRLLGWRDDEPHVPHPVVEVLPQVGGADRLAVAVVRAPEAVTITSLDVQVTPETPFVARMELHDVAVCAPVTGPACIAGRRGSPD